MCNQTVSLVAAEFERQGIATVVLQFVREVAEKIGPPRALVVPYRHGFPLGEPNQPDLQRKIIRAALELFAVESSRPVLREFNS